jgi:hypothetical protein
MYRRIINFNKGYQPRNNIVRDEKGDLVTDFHRFWLGGEIFSLRYCIYMGLVMLGIQ